MAIIRNLASGMLKGKVGDTTYYVSQSRQLARQAMNNSNYGESASRTDVQQNRRVRWANLVNFYSGNKAWMKKAYENLKPGVSIFNRFMQLNINSATVALTRSEAQAKIWVPAIYRVSQGSLAPLTFEYINSVPVLSLDGAISVESTTTVGQVSQSLISANPTFRNGDAIAAVAFYGTMEEPGTELGMVPATYDYREFVVDTTDETPFNQKYRGLSFVDGGLHFDAADGASAAVFIHTRKNAGKLFVSTQDMILNTGENTAYDAWRDSAQFTKAIASYGESTTVPLAPGGWAVTISGNDSSTGGGDKEPGTDLGE